MGCSADEETTTVRRPGRARFRELGAGHTPRFLDGGKHDRDATRRLVGDLCYAWLAERPRGAPWEVLREPLCLVGETRSRQSEALRNRAQLQTDHLVQPGQHEQLCHDEGTELAKMTAPPTTRLCDLVERRPELRQV